MSRRTPVILLALGMSLLTACSGASSTTTTAAASSSPSTSTSPNATSSRKAGLPTPEKTLSGSVDVLPLVQPITVTNGKYTIPETVPGWKLTDDRSPYTYDNDDKSSPVETIQVFRVPRPDQLLVTDPAIDGSFVCGNKIVSVRSAASTEQGAPCALVFDQAVWLVGPLLPMGTDEERDASVEVISGILAANKQA